METINQMIIDEKAILDRFIEKYQKLSKGIDNGYTVYHSYIADCCLNLSTLYTDSILEKLNIRNVDPSNVTLDEFKKIISSIDFKNNDNLEILDEIWQLKTNPLYIRALGEESLTDDNLEELEEVLEVPFGSINNIGMHFLFDYSGNYKPIDVDSESYKILPNETKKRIVSTKKTVEQLINDYKRFNKILTYFYKNNMMEKVDYDICAVDLKNIYDYYISESMGQQLIYPKFSNYELNSIIKSIILKTKGKKVEVLLKNYDELKNIIKPIEREYDNEKRRIINERNNKFYFLQKLQEEYLNNQNDNINNKKRTYKL